MRAVWNTGAAWAALLCVGALTASAQEDPGEARARMLLQGQLRFEAYTFSGNAFPQGRFDDALQASVSFGPYRVTPTFYDAKHRPVLAAAKAGPYAAIVEVAPAQGRPFRRYATLYRLPAPVSSDRKLETVSPAEFAALTGTPSAAVNPNWHLVQERVKGRGWGELAADARFARLLAGLRQGKPGTDPAWKNEDAYVQERQWWLGLKRKLTEFDRRYPRRFVGPTPIQGKPAPVVREGSLAEAAFKPDAVQKIDAICQEWAANSDQAFAVCVVRNGVIVIHKPYGTRDGKPMTLDTKSWMASVTKTMSATLMMMLVDQGLVSLDDPVDKFLPPLRGVSTRQPLLVRHLYTHTSGLHKWPGQSDELPDVEETVAGYAPYLPVGQEWGYNGMGYTLGGKIIENVSGEAVPLFFKRHLLEPLGATRTDVIATHADAFSVPLDMARFGQMLLNRGAYGRRRFFREETFAQMLPRKLTMELGPETTRTFGVGLDGQPRRFGHGTASAATFSVDVEEKLIIIVTRNKDGLNWDKYQGRFHEAVRAGLLPLPQQAARG